MKLLNYIIHRSNFKSPASRSGRYIPTRKPKAGSVNRTSYIVNRTFLFVLLFSFSTSFGQTNLADAEYIKLVKEYQLNADGSVTFHYQHSLKYLTHYAFHTLCGETPVTYNTRFQKVKVNYARTTMADGSVIESPANAYNEILPGFAAVAPVYNHIRTLVITHTGLEVNAVAEVDYEVTSDKTYYPCLMGNECLKNVSPVDEYTYIVRVPAGQQLQYKLLNSDVQPEISQVGEFTQYKWSFKNLPALSADKFKPHPHSNEPYLIYCSAKDLQKSYTDFVSQPSLNYKANEKMISWANEIRRNSKSDMDFILKLQEKIAKEVKTYAIPLAFTGYSIQSPSEVFSTNGGTVIEKAGLMAALLNNSGIKAVPVLVAPTVLVNKEIGNVNLFEDVLVKVFLKADQYIYLPVNQTVKQDMKYQLNGKTIIPLNSETKMLEYFTENNSENKLVLTSILNADIQDKSASLKGSYMAMMSGCVNPFFKFITDSAEVAKSILNSAVPGKDDDIKIIKQGLFESAIGFNATLAGTSVSKEADYYFISLPRFNDGYDHWQLTVLPVERTTAVGLPHPLVEKYNFTVTLPKGYELANDDVNINISNKAGSLVIQLSKEKTGFRLVRELTLPDANVSIDQYTQLREILNVWRDQINKPIVVKKAEIIK